MMPALTRRRLVQAGAAAIGATVTGTTASAQAAPSTDAFLLNLIARYGSVVAERNAHASVHEAAEKRFKAAVPPRPEALTETFSDVLDHLPSTGRDTRPNGRPWCYFTPSDVERLRGAGHVTELAWGEDGEPLPPVLNQRGERRRLAILAAHDAWAGEKQVLADRVGLTAAEAEDDRLYEAVWSLRDAVRETTPATVAGLRAKAKWALSLDDREEEDERVVRDLAAFGQVTS